ncbi:DsrE family protein [Thiogranum longum]|jgi:intracellular sulfur oxidation DsrE/DsrF family protein
MKSYLPALAIALGLSTGLLPFSLQAEPLDKKPESSTDLYHPERIMPVPKAPDDKPFAEHFAVFHISSGDEFAQKLVLNNAQNLANFYGPDKVMIEVVAYGPGLRALFKENTQAARIKRMADQGITFSACANTMTNMGRDTPSLHKAAKVVPGGVVRIMELQEAGWTYIRP